ncbi:MAG: L-threonylcarbamoyladenylate synthase [Sphingomonadaceae bacterium]
MSQFQTRVLPCSPAAIAEAARLVGKGLAVAVPTETVYGLAADATDAEAVARIYQAKGRPAFNPLIVHVGSLAQARRLARFEASAEELAARFWPGPLTLVLPLKPGGGIASIVTAGLGTVALRVPAHPAMRDLLATCRKPLAAPSANASGRLSPTRAGHVLASLGGRIPLVIDGGPAGHGVESTIVAPGPDGLRLLRPGPIAIGELEAASRPTRPRPLPAGEGRIEAPGQLESHYAPAKPLRLEATEAKKDEWHIGFGGVAGDASLSAAGDLVEAAAHLFDRLHEAEASGKPRIAVAPVPEQGLGLAINDRLKRAAAPSGLGD